MPDDESRCIDPVRLDRAKNCSGRPEKLPSFQFAIGALRCLLAKDEQVIYVADCVFNIESPAGKQTIQCRYFEKIGSQLQPEKIQDWISSSAGLLSGHEIMLASRDFRRWQIPSFDELHRLGRITGNRVPDAFGPTEMERAVTKFGEGDVQGCMDMFSKMLADEDDAGVRNNLAFCQILTGAVTEVLRTQRRQSQPL